MARIFTIPFAYNGKTFTAVISQTGEMLSIYIPDETLHTILPGGKVSFPVKEGIKLNTPELNQAQDLLISVLSHVESHHNTSFQYSLRS